MWYFDPTQQHANCLQLGSHCWVHCRWNEFWTVFKGWHFAKSLLYASYTLKKCGSHLNWEWGKANNCIDDLHCQHLYGCIPVQTLFPRLLIPAIPNKWSLLCHPLDAAFSSQWLKLRHSGKTPLRSGTVSGLLCNRSNVFFPQHSFVFMFSS